MSYNTALTNDGNGILIYNGEMLLIYSPEVVLNFDNYTNPDFKGKKEGSVFLTSHRIIFKNQKYENFRSFSIPFHCLRDVKLEQPIFGANYLKGAVVAQPNGNWDGSANWKLTFNRGGCIDFGMALLRANDMANNYRPLNAPPPYAPPAGSYFAPPPDYYMAGGNQFGFQAPIQAFPDQPPAGTVFMYDQPPPYPGIGPDQAPRPVPTQHLYPLVGQAPYPAVPGQFPPTIVASAPYPPASQTFDTVASAPPYTSNPGSNSSSNQRGPPSYDQATTSTKDKYD